MMTQNTRIATVTLNPAIDQTASIPNFTAGEVNRVEWEQSDPGGKGVNVASFLADFGYHVAVTGFLGSANSGLFESLFGQKKIEDQFVRIPGKTRVNVKIVDEVRRQVTDINFPGPTGTDQDVASLKQNIETLSADCDWFVLSGSVPTGIPAGLYGELVSLLKGKGRQVVLDTSGEGLRQAVSAAPYAIKPNIDELQELVGESLQTEAEILNAARTLVKGGIACVVVSMGKRGAIFVEAQESVLATPPTVTVKSTVGAGDAMVAGTVTAKLRGLALADCARLATAFSMGALSQLGPRLPDPETVKSFMDQVTVRTCHE
jgi:1-phosphofructokinase